MTRITLLRLSACGRTPASPMTVSKKNPSVRLPIRRISYLAADRELEKLPLSTVSSQFAQLRGWVCERSNDLPILLAAPTGRCCSAHEQLTGLPSAYPPPRGWLEMMIPVIWMIIWMLILSLWMNFPWWILGWLINLSNILSDQTLDCWRCRIFRLCQSRSCSGRAADTDYPDQAGKPSIGERRVTIDHTDQPDSGHFTSRLYRKRRINSYFEARNEHIRLWLKIWRFAIRNLVSLLKMFRCGTYVSRASRHWPD